MKQLDLYRTILPTLERIVRGKRGDHEDIRTQLEGLISAKVFDCRAVPVDFIIDSGEAYRHEIERNGSKVHIPFSHCYFEFGSNEAILAISLEKSVDNLDDVDSFSVVGETVEVYGYAGFTSGLKDRVFEDSVCPTFAYFTNGLSLFDALGDDDDSNSCFDIVNSVHNSAADYIVNRSAILILGILSLMSEKLLLDETLPDPTPWSTRKRVKSGKPPKSGETHIITVNVPAVRYAVSQSNETNLRNEQVASPALHWRRGHWRTLHRGSEFESRTWVKKCLVGDPNKGFTESTYRVTSHMPLTQVAISTN